MTQTGADVTEVGQLQTNQTPQAGVEGPRVLQGVADVFKGISNVLIAENDKKREGQKQEIVNKFTIEQLKVADLVDQGLMSPQMGRTMHRKNLVQFTNDHGTLGSEFIKVQGQVISTAGLGKVVSEGTDADKNEAKLIGDLVNTGVLSPDATSAEQDEAMELFSITQAVSTSLAQQQASLQLQLTTNQLRGSTRKEIKAELARNAYKTLTNKTRIGYRSFSNQIDGLVAQKTGDGESNANLLIELEQAYNQVLNDNSADLALVTPDERTALLANFKGKFDLAKKQISGEVTAATIATFNEIAINREKALLTNEPTMAKAVALVDLFGGQNISGNLFSQLGVAEYLANNSVIGGGAAGGGPVNPFAAGAGTPEEFRAYLKGLSELAGIDGITPEGKDQIAIQSQNILDSIEDYTGFLKKNPEGAIELVNFMSTPEFLVLRNAAPEIWGNNSAASELLTEHYAREVETLVSKEFKKAKVINGSALKQFEMLGGGEAVKKVPTSSLVTYGISNSGIVFSSIDPNNRVANNEAARLNKKLKPIIDKTVRGFGNLMGRNDFEKISSDLMPHIFGGEGSDTLGGGIDNDLNLTDFDAKEAKKVKESGLSALIDKREGAGDYDTLLGFAQKDGKQFAGVKVSEMTIQQVVDFSKAGGDYANYSKGVVDRVATPMGRYQIVGTTLVGLIKDMKLDPTTVFNKATQDAMFARLAKRRLRRAKGGGAAEKRRQMRLEWEGFKHVSNSTLDKAIKDFENSK